MSNATHHSVGLSGEQLDHKVAAICETRQQAEQIAMDLCAQTSVEKGQVTVVRPGEPHPGRELEPESSGIWRTMIRSHVTLGLAGAGGGLLLFVILYAAGIPFVELNAVWSAALFTGFGALCGLMLGGAFTLRPDHTPYLMKTRSSLKAGKHIVAVHASDQTQLNEARRQLEQWGLKTVRTL